MTVIATRKLSEIAEAIGKGADPRQAIIAAIGQKAIDDFEPFHNLILIGTHVRSDRSKGGIYLGGDRTRAEDRFQGKIGLVLKCGPMAFKDDQINKFGDVHIKAGDWIMYRPSDAHEFFFVDASTGMDGTSARLIEDTHVKARVADPELIF